MITRVGNVELGIGDYRPVLDEDFRRRYASGRDPWTDEPAMKAPVATLLAALPAGPHAVLDVGAGRGRDVTALLDAGHRVTGVDLVATPEWPRLREQWGKQVSLLEGSFLDLELPTRFTGVLDNGCLHHQHPDEHPAFLARIRDLLEPGGTAVLSTFTPDHEHEPSALWLTSDGRLNYEFSLLDLSRLAAGAGLRLADAVRVPRELHGLQYLVVALRREA
ncbi:MAG TPA: methyltransferase domain-containing protein [Solirubrobacteraceae bacterium]|jgi:SAM-dependent methyltransferase|nr:methyltransferase domain-containing protein [Solirubrobacteraceae bacterium]